MDYNETVSQTKRSDYEKFLTLCSGLRITAPRTSEEVAYNNALGDIYDFIIKNNANNLFEHTVRCGLWERNPEIEPKQINIGLINQLEFGQKVIVKEYGIKKHGVVINKAIAYKDGEIDSFEDLERNTSQITIYTYR